uniref:NAD(P)(+)--arginine ADP-ribosyltransferase n=1 Tax=Pelusios castaneus TaxID=367368 RepID=A0A8C8SC63_9SAUR
MSLVQSTHLSSSLLIDPFLPLFLTPHLHTTPGSHSHWLYLKSYHSWDAFDDQYIGCEEEMDRRAPDLLKKEKSNSSLFSTAWENSRKKWQSVKTKISLYLPPDFTDEHGRAIVTYTDKEFSRMLNQAVRENGKSQADYMDNFYFKAFHYYLTRGLRLLNGSCDVTYKMEVFRGVSGIRFKHKGPGLMRFGQFTSSSLKKEVAEKFGTDSFFTIRTCFGRDIRAFSHSPEEDEVLIPFNEKFSVFKGKGNNSFVLRSTNRTCSYFNCAYLGGEYRAGQEKHLSGVFAGVNLKRERELRRETLTCGGLGVISCQTSCC